MNRQESAWERFEKTGCIFDYLAYCRISSGQGTEGGLSYADFDRRHRAENEASGQ